MEERRLILLREIRQEANLLQVKRSERQLDQVSLQEHWITCQQERSSFTDQRENLYRWVTEWK